MIPCSDWATLRLYWADWFESGCGRIGAAYRMTPLSEAGRSLEVGSRPIGAASRCPPGGTVDAADLKSAVVRRGGSSPPVGRFGRLDQRRLAWGVRGPRMQDGGSSVCVPSPCAAHRAAGIPAPPAPLIRHPNTHCRSVGLPATCDQLLARYEQNSVNKNGANASIILPLQQ